MNGPALPDLLRRRFDMVARLSDATSRLQKCQQTRMSAEMDVQRCEMSELTVRGLHRELDEARLRSQEADDAIARCEALIAEVESELDAVDREIASKSGRQS